MRFSGKIDELDLKELQRMLRPKWYWPKFALQNWYGLAIVCVILWATVAAVLEGKNTNWSGLGLLWLIVGAFVAWVVYRTKTSMSSEFARLNVNLPDWVDLTSGGIKLDGPDGEYAFQPWMSFVTWREGRRLILLNQTRDRGVLVLPIANLSDVQKEQIRQLLQANISPSRTNPQSA